MRIKASSHEEALALRPKIHVDPPSPHLEIQPLRDGVLVSVYPPKTPSRNVNHMPCDIVLVIDVSYSMHSPAPVPTEDPSEKEQNGLSVLDLVKHAARTILETLDDNDRLGVVTFSDEAKVIQNLLPMTAENKKKAWNRIERLQVEGMTNLWHGILNGIKLFKDNQNTTSTPAVMILTDGLPNSMCPAQGYVPKLRTYDFQPSIHTFGFGYTIRSGLLKSIAEYTGGNYAFIPDPGMIGTVFVHAVANLQSTYAPETALKISGSDGLTLIETVGDYLRKADPRKPEQLYQPGTNLTIPLGSLQYGQSRDILLRYGNIEEVRELNPTVNVELQCRPLDETEANLTASCKIDELATLAPEMEVYQRFRSITCEFLSTIAPLSESEEHVPIEFSDAGIKRKELEAIIHQVTGMAPQGILKSLAEDLTGQIRLALTDEHIKRWGVHYLLSIHNAHAKQLRNSFKDPGPLQYGKDSPFFQKCRDELDHAFDSLPPPKPSLNVVPARSRGNTAKPAAMSMRMYNNREGVCFAADTMVKLACESKTQLGELKSGMMVWTPKGGRSLVAIVATTVANEEMCVIGDLVVTCWHPICVDQKWVFPKDVTHSTIKYTGTIYSLLLEPDADDRCHAVEVGGHLAVTLGHGVTQPTEDDDARVHRFFGDYLKVSEALKTLNATDGVYQCKGIARDVGTGLVCGFLSG